MSDLKAKFEAAVAASKTLKEKPDNQTLLQLYALYKQATEGDVTGKRPGMMDMVGRAKYDAWAKLEGTAAETAMKSYTDLVKKLKAG
ncbi:MAG: acyl-CoA-binding protein [Rhodocyclaceae bacterium]|nr:acyl-CoA-binding protein [Rhodocyclaceae bacterium]